MNLNRRELLRSVFNLSLVALITPHIFLKNAVASNGALMQEMQLSSGHFIQIARSGTRKGFQNHTLHLVKFWVSKKDFDSGKSPFHTEDFEIQWHSAHPEPLARMKRIFELYASHMSGAGAGLPDEHWSNLPDTHGNLSRMK